MTLQRTLRAEGGFALIEVVVSAAVLAIIALAILSGIDAANGASAREKARAVAASLAEQDQERLRSMNIDKVAAPPQQPDQVIDGVTYKIKSEARWITDNVGGSPACGEDGTQVEYLHITSTVTSHIVGERIPPVKIDSLVAPSAKKAESQGVLGVKVVDRNGVGLPGITVTATSPAYSPPAGVTDSDGCVVFSAVPVGNYTVRLNTAGYIDRAGNQVSEQTQLVAPKKVSWVNMTYDRATSARVSVVTVRPGSANWANPIPSKARHISTANGANVGWIKSVGPSNPGISTADLTNLFPFAENSYAFFTGKCGYSSPDKYLADYFTDPVNGNPAATLLSNPSAMQPQLINSVRQPPFNIRIARNRAGQTNFTDGTIQVWARLNKPSSSSSDDCVEEWFELTTMTHPSPAPSPSTHFVSQKGGSFDPGMPFGKYTICIRDTGASNRVWTYGEYDNTAPRGRSSTLTITPPTSSSTQWSSTSASNVNRCLT
jgi:type II secretory pathway pseudopilin PulG